MIRIATFLNNLLKFIKEISYNFAEKHRESKILKFLLKVFFHPKLWSFKPKELSGGIALGLFIAFTPFMGFHSVLIIIFSYLFRVNMLIGLILVWISNPVTYLPMLYFEYFLGCKILNTSITLHFFQKPLNFLYEAEVFKAILVGSFITSSIAAFLGYNFSFFLFSLERYLRYKHLIKRKHRSKKQ